MAGVLEPGGIPPKPKGVGRPAMSPAASMKKLGNTALNFNQAVSAATSIPGFSDVFGYGGSGDPANLTPNEYAEAVNQSLGIEATTYDSGYREYLNPASGTRYEFQNFGTNPVTGEVEPGTFGPAVGDYDIPTSTSNFKRPRTLAAGYDPDNEVVTVVFRDGTFYNYYGISQGTWTNFKESYSKGPFLNARSENRDAGTLVRECSAMGAADLSQMGEEARNFFITVARSAQIALRENRPRYNKGYKTAGSQLKSYRNRQYRAKLRAAKQSVATNINASRSKNPSTGGKNRATANKPA